MKKLFIKLPSIVKDNIRKIVLILVLFIIVLIALDYGIKTIPDYTKESKFDIVWRSDYDNYQRGYCLVENRILSEEEILRKALTQLFIKRIILSQKIEDFRINYYGGNHKLYWQFDQTKYNFEKPKIAYYGLENVTVDNFYDKFFQKYNFKNNKAGLLDLFFNEFKAKEINPMNLIEIKGDRAYFTKPVVYLSPRNHYDIYLKKFKVKKFADGYKLLENPEFLYEGESRQGIEHSLQHYAIDKGFYDLKIDNCGNIDYKIEEIFEEVKFLSGG